MSLLPLRQRASTDPVVLKHLRQKAEDVGWAFSEHGPQSPIFVAAWESFQAAQAVFLPKKGPEA